MLAVMRLQMRQILAEKKFFFVALLLAIPIALSVIIHFVADKPNADEPNQEFGVAAFLYFFYPQSVLILLSLLYGTSIINAELEGKTLTYLFTRAIPKWKVVIGKYVALVATMTVPVAISMTISWLFLWAPGGAKLLGGLCFTGFAAVATYTAIFAAIGTFVQKRPIILGIVYGMIETFMSFVPSMAGSMTVTYFLRTLALRSIHVDYQKMPEEIVQLLGDMSFPGACLVLGLMIVIALFISAFGASTKEYVITEQV